MHESEEGYSGANAGSTDTTAPLVLMMFLLGALGILGGYAAAGLCFGVAIVINIVHNLLPKFVFILPIAIVLFMAIAPIAYGMGLGTCVGRIALGVRCRHGDSAGLVALFWAVTGIVLFPSVAEACFLDGQKLFEFLIPFVELMIGGCINLDWLATPEPVDVADWIIYTVLGIATFLGALGAWGQASDMVEENVN